jgi:nicotinamidase-related amidase
MPSESPNTALLLIDWLNPFDFIGGQNLKKHAELALPNAMALARWCQDREFPVIIVNDNFGQWSSDQQALWRRALSEDFPGQKIARTLTELENDYFVLKPRHSAFHHTVLDLLLKQLETERLILSGLASNICVLFTANDAHLRDFSLWVPTNCSAAETQQDHDYAMRHFERVLDCSVEEFNPQLNLSVRDSCRSRQGPGPGQP